MSRRHRFTPFLAAGAFAVLAGLATPALADAPFGGPQNLGSAGGPLALATGDLDGDGDADMLASSFNDLKIYWYEATGPSNLVRHTIGSGLPLSIATADLDGDGDADVLTAANSGSLVAWHENGGDGTSWTAHTVATPPQAAAAAAADIDADGDLDILTGAVGNSRVDWYENDGAAGGWTLHVVSTILASPTIVASADMDNDGDADALAADATNNSLGWHENDGAGGGWTRHGMVGGRTPSSFALSDLDRDGDTDVAEVAGVQGVAEWYENDGSGLGWTPHALTTLATSTLRTESIAAADLDRDGDTDLALTVTAAGLVRWLENDGAAGSFTAHTLTDAANQPWDVVTVDLDRDGDVEVAHIQFGSGALTVQQNLSNHRGACLPEDSVSTASATTDGAYALAAADLDTDGDLDLVVPARSGNAVRWFESDGAGGWTTHTVADPFADAAAVASADIDRDGDLDVLAGSYDGAVAWFENDGSAGGWAAHAVGTTSGARSVVAADVDGDGDRDVLATASDDEWIAWFANDGSGGGWTAQTLAVGTTVSPGSIAAADVDEDGDLDAFVASAGFPRKAWLENGGATWTVHAIDATGAESGGTIAAGDIDRDGDTDLVGLFFDNDRVEWYENAGGGGWTPHALYTALGADVGAVRDADEDGDLDVLAKSAYAPTIVLLENDGAGAGWTPHAIATSGGFVSGVAAADLDGDGDTDVAAVRPSSDAVTVHENRSGHLSLAVTDTAAATTKVGYAAALLAIEASHLGREGDADVSLERLRLRLEDAGGIPLSSAQANAIVSSLEVVRDADDNGRLDTSDTTVGVLGPLSLDGAGETDVDLGPVSETRTPFGGDTRYLVVAHLTDDADQQTPHAFRIVHVGVGTGLEDADHEVALQAACPTDATSSVTTAIPLVDQLRNGSFESGATPWSFAFPRRTARDCTTASDGACSALIRGGAGQAVVRQVVATSGPAGARLRLSVESQATGAPSGHEYAAWLVFENRDGSRSRRRALLFAPGTHPWQTETATVLAPRPFRRVTVELRYAAPAGRVWFDGVSLKR